MLVIGDLHITPTTRDRAAQILKVAEGSKEDTILLAGDVFDTKEVIRGKCQKLLFDHIRQSSKAWYIIVGNHDYFTLDCKQGHSLEVFKALENVTVVDEVKNIPALEDGTPPFSVMPYVPNAEFRSELKKAKHDTVFIHQGVNGFDLGNGKIEEDGVDKKVFGKFKSVISGHFHKYQQEGKLTYLGTPYSLNFGEANQTKYIFRWGKEGLESFKTDLPRHVQIEVNASSNFQKVSQMIYDTNPSHNFVRVILKGSEKDVESFPSEKFPSVDFRRNPTVFEGEAEVSDALSNEKQFEEVAKKMDLSEEQIKSGIRLLEESK